jgi:hypothetical protein
VSVPVRLRGKFERNVHQGDPASYLIFLGYTHRF